MKKKKIYLSSGLIFLVFVFCAGPGSWVNRIEWDDFTMETIPTPSVYPDEGAVILLDEGDLDIFQSDNSNYTVLKRHRLVRLFDERGYRYANVTIPYSGLTEIKNINARTISPNGKITPLHKKQIFDITLYPDFIFYSDIKAKRFTLPAVEKGCIIEYTWEAISKHHSYRDQWIFQHEIPVMISRYTIKAPALWDVNWKSNGLDIKPQVEGPLAGDKKKYLWEVMDLPALIPEAGMPPVRRSAVSLQFSPVEMKKWQDVAQWYRSLIVDRIQANKDIVDFTIRLTRDCLSDREKLKKIYEFVRDKIRYIAIEIGIGGYQPHFAADVFSNRYGDCKDKVTLIMAMASSVGLKVDPVIISTYQNGKVDTVVASPVHFNHVIARAVLADEEEMWMDATEEYCPFGSLPWYDQNRMTFLVDDEGKGFWKKTPVSKTNDNLIKRNWSLTVDSTGNCRGEIRMQFLGANALNLRHRIWDLREKQKKTWFKRELFSKFPNAKIKEFAIDGFYEFDKPLEIICQFQWALPLTINNSTQFSMQRFCDFNLHEIFVEENRSYGIELTCPSQATDSLRIFLDDNMQFDLNLRNNFINNTFGGYRMQHNVDASQTLHIIREFRMNKTDIPVADYSDYKAFLNAVAEFDQSYFQIKKDN